MPYKKVPKGHSEFGGGPGMIDATRRADRAVGTNTDAMGYQNMGEELWEVYATNPADPESSPETSTVERP